VVPHESDFKGFDKFVAPKISHQKNQKPVEKSTFFFPTMVDAPQNEENLRRHFLTFALHSLRNFPSEKSAKKGKSDARRPLEIRIFLPQNSAAISAEFIDNLGCVYYENHL
jgi:hypothetical protein